MIELWGSDACVSCTQALTIITKTPMSFIYKKVEDMNPEFEGEIPRLVIENKDHIIGLGPINSYIKKWKQERGIA